ncbi:MAG TPA: condensation domain-containing protein, partial [Candidatus Elarobacter sp.]|nr:condensation domain-containing protein [Candidatus Elarobacter sp.]
LSFAQQRMWFLSQMEGVSETYHVPLGLSISGELDRLALARALDHVVARHESLRTSFPFVEGELVQRIAPPDTLFALLEHDVRGRDDATAHVDALIAEEAGAPFDLQAGPLIRGRLIRPADTEHVLLITMHHAVSDGWSVGVLVRELSASYRAYHAGDEHDPLPPLPIQYADYAAWQRQRLSGAVLAKQAEYWRRTLAGAPELLELPTDRVRPAVQDHVGGQVLVELDAELTARVKALGQRHGTTLYMTLLTAWGTLLSRLSGQTDLVVGTPAANRTRPEVEDLIGFFINAQALRLDFSGGPTVAEMLARVKARALGAQEHQELPFEQVVEIVNPPRSLAHAPLFQVVFAWQSAEQGEFDVPGLRVAQLRSPYSVSKFDLAFSFVESGDRLGGMLEYATVLFDRATVERYVGYFRNVLVAMVADDARRVDELPLLSGGERHTILVDWNATGAPYPSERGIHELFEEQAAKTPAAIAVVHGDERLTYRELNERANKLARRLRDTGVLPGSRVAISLARSIHLVVAQLAVLKCGAIYVPLDESAPAARQTFIMEDCRVATVLTDTARTVPAVAGVQQIDLDAVSLDAHAPGDLGVPAHGGIPAYIIYTSGS